MRPGRQALLVAGAFAPYYLNDLVFISQPGWAVHYAVDVGSRLLSVGCLALAVWPAALPPAGQRYDRVLALALAAALLAVIDAYWLDQLLRPLVPLPALAPYPEIPIPALALLDTWAGLLLVAVSEELAFRAYLMRRLQQTGGSRAAVLLSSALLFALIHWSGGLLQVSMAAIYGVILGLMYLSGRRLAWPILTHYGVNLIYFTA